jgi:predicted nucleic acid-binding protein
MEEARGAVPPMRLILDTNCYVSYLNQRDKGQHKSVSLLMDAVSRAEHEVLMTGHNMTEMVFVLQNVYEMDAKMIHEILTALLANPGFEFAPGHHPEEILKIWPNQVKDYGDAVLAAAASALGAKICTFDQAFARVLRKVDLHADLI